MPRSPGERNDSASSIRVVGGKKKKMEKFSSNDGSYTRPLLSRILKFLGSLRSFPSFMHFEIDKYYIYISCSDLIHCNYVNIRIKDGISEGEVTLRGIKKIEIRADRRRIITIREKEK